MKDVRIYLQSLTFIETLLNRCHPVISAEAFVWLKTVGSVARFHSLFSLSLLNTASLAKRKRTETNRRG